MPWPPVAARRVRWITRRGRACLYIEIGDYENTARSAFHAKRELAPDQDLLLYRESLDEIIPLEGKSEQEILHCLTGGGQ